MDCAAERPSITIAIDGATGIDLVLTQDDIGHNFSVHAGYTDAQGFMYSGDSEIASATTPR